MFFTLDAFFNGVNKKISVHFVNIKELKKELFKHNDNCISLDLIYYFINSISLIIIIIINALFLSHIGFLGSLSAGGDEL